MLATAKEWFHRFQIGKIDRLQLNAQVNSQLTDEMVQAEAGRLKRYGTPKSYTFMRSYFISGAAGYDFLLQFDTGQIVEMIALDGNGKIAGIDFQLFEKK